MARAHGIEDVFDPNYVPDPLDHDENLEFYYKQTFFYAVLLQTIKPYELLQFVEQQAEYSDAQQVLIDMNRHIRQSTYAVITTADMMKEITTTVFDARTWDRPVLEWVIGFDKLMTEYNQLQRIQAMKFTEIMKRTYMQQALRNNKPLQEISDREQERMVTGEPPFTYPQYLSLIKSKATRMDVAKKPKKTREAQMHNTTKYMEEDDDSDDLEVNVMKSTDNVPGSRMPLSTWKSLSEETQSVWDQIDPAEKAKILSASRDDSKKPRRHANFAEQTAAETIEANVHNQNDDSDDTLEPNERPSIQANTALSTARKEAHPGDPRRLLGSDRPSKQDTEKGSTRSHDTKSHLEAMIHTYTVSDDEQSDESEDFRSYWDDQDFR